MVLPRAKSNGAAAVPLPAMREQILDAARSLIKERGFAGVSLADIAGAVGVSKTAVAYHYHPKDRLLFELLEQPRVGLQRLLSTPLDRSSFVAEYVRYVIQNRDTFGMILFDPALVRHPVFGERIKQGRRAVVERLNGEAGSSSSVLGWAVLGAINIAVLEATNMDSARLEREVTMVARRMLEGPQLSSVESIAL